MYHTDDTIYKVEEAIKNKDNKFDYTRVDTVEKFDGKHPAVMREREIKENWSIEIDTKKKKFSSVKKKVLYFLDKKFGWRPFEYRNYIKI